MAAKNLKRQMTDSSHYDQLLGGGDAAIQNGPNWVLDPAGYGTFLRPFPGPEQQLSPIMQLLDYLRRYGAESYQPGGARGHSGGQRQEY